MTLPDADAGACWGCGLEADGRFCLYCAELEPLAARPGPPPSRSQSDPPLWQDMIFLWAGIAVGLWTLFGCPGVPGIIPL